MVKPIFLNLAFVEAKHIVIYSLIKWKQTTSSWWKNSFFVTTASSSMHAWNYCVQYRSIDPSKIVSEIQTLVLWNSNWNSISTRRKGKRWRKYENYSLEHWFASSFQQNRLKATHFSKRMSSQSTTSMLLLFFFLIFYYLIQFIKYNKNSVLHPICC